MHKAVDSDKVLAKEKQIGIDDRTSHSRQSYFGDMKLGQDGSFTKIICSRAGMKMVGLGHPYVVNSSLV